MASCRRRLCLSGLGTDVFSTNLVLLAVDFFNHLNMLYGTVTEFVSEDQRVMIKTACLCLHLRYLCSIFQCTPTDVREAASW